MNSLKKLLPFLVLCSFLAVSCGVSKKQPTTQQQIEKKALDLANLKGATVESVTLEDGTIALKVTFDSGILFGFNKTDLSDEAQESLKELVENLEDFPGARFRVYGHTDIVGSAEVNQKVSADRAKSVAAFLEKEGIAQDHIVAEGLSFNYPVADNSTEAGRAKNHRVEIYVIPAQ